MLNQVAFQGRMVADPELKETNSGAKVVNFRVAWSEKYKDKENRCFLECKAFGAQAEFLCNYFRKGQDILVQGKLHTEEWETDGQKRSKNVLMISSIHFCGKKESTDASAAPASATATEQGGFTAVETDELPF